MFEGVADQFHQFIAASRTSSSSPLPLPLSFPPFHGSNSNSTAFSSFDHHPYTTAATTNFLHPLHQSSEPTTKNLALKQENLVLETNQRSIQEPAVDPWSNEEILALLRIRSSMENWFPEFTWEHVSRKLAELGFKRSGEKCKEKFEEESRFFSNINYSKNINFRVFGDELEDLYTTTNNNNNNQIPHQDQEEKAKINEEDSRIDYPTEEDNNEKEIKKSKKRKRQKKFEMFKGFCEDIIRKIMTKQEEMHNKLIEDMVKRDEEKIAKEEAWKKQEMDRINKEFEIRVQEQVLAVDRQKTIINFLKNFSSSSSSSSSGTASSSDHQQILEQATHDHLLKVVVTQNPNLKPPLQENQEPQNPNSTPLFPLSNTQNPKILNTQITPLMDIVHKKSPIKSHDKDDLGKRWPKDEVLALINLRSSLCNEDKDQTTLKGPLWERISQGMVELGYKRSAKRCKEKWENINKYFRKTKDINKKRSVDSRTCPYFQQLTSLYNQGALPPPSSDLGPERRSPENHSEGEKNPTRATGYEFEF
ncbi:trihelix transcription factor GTL2-like [Mercurialis annua]|uniref:trihelix transcription factor GTL2-like n=1 Tax=Mercurialis annua TaxID=3986 RepID=UPI00215E8C50|nr:trihelix transcription factor GTL2-like [Mercurialis annua]